MSAVCANRKQFDTMAHQDHVFATCLTERYPSVRNIANENSISKIALLSFLRVYHVYATVSLISNLR